MRDPEIITTERVVSLVAPGRVGDPASQGKGDTGKATTGMQYVTWSGATATVHKRLILGVTGYGLGSELA